MRVWVNDRMQMQKAKFIQTLQQRRLSCLYITALWRKCGTFTSFLNLCLRLKFKPVSFKCFVLKPLQTEPGLGTTQSTVCFLGQKHRETEHPENPSNKVGTNLFRDPVSLHFWKRPQGMLGHPRNARCVKWYRRQGCWQTPGSGLRGRLIFTSDHHSGGGLAALLIRRPFVSPQKRARV